VADFSEGEDVKSFGDCEVFSDSKFRLIWSAVSGGFGSSGTSEIIEKFSISAMKIIK